MIKELTDIRHELLQGVEDKDLLYITMQINRIDTILYNASKDCSLDVVSIKSLKAHTEKQIEAARKLTKFNNDIGNTAQERKEQGKYLAYKDIIDGINNGAFKD